MQVIEFDDRHSCENCGYFGLETFQIVEDQHMLFCPDCLLYQKGTDVDRSHYHESGYHKMYAKRRRSKVMTASIRLGALTRHMEINSPRILDVGCSVGATLEAAEKMGWKASGVDVSAAAVQFCRDSGYDCEAITGTALPYEDNSFDVLTNWHVIEHVEDVRATLAEWIRVIRPGGFMVLETPDSQCFKARRLGAKYRKFWPKGHIYTFTRSNMESILQQTGFDILESATIGKLSALPVPLTAYAMAYRSWRKLNRSLGFCKSIEVVCQKPANQREKFAADQSDKAQKVAA